MSSRRQTSSAGELEAKPKRELNASLLARCAEATTTRRTEGTRG
jgi:hypothetical protein